MGTRMLEYLIPFTTSREGESGRETASPSEIITAILTDQFIPIEWSMTRPIWPTARKKYDCEISCREWAENEVTSMKLHTCSSICSVAYS